MPWSSVFRAELTRQVIKPIFVLETMELWNEGLGTSGYSVASASSYGVDTMLVIGSGGPTGLGARLDPGSWTCTTGSWSIPLAGDIRTLRRCITRGTAVRLKMGFLGWPSSDFEMIAAGQVYALRGVGTRWVLEVRDLLAALEGRPTLTLNQLALFYSQGPSRKTTLGAAYTVGDASVQVASLAEFTRDTGGSGVGCVMLDDGTNTFFLTYTGTATGPNRLTGVSAAGQFGTIAANMASGEDVYNIVLLRGHPLDIVRRLLTSRGVTGNGLFDHYPVSWGYGFSHSLVDNEDIEAWKTKVVKVSSGSYQWDVNLADRQAAPRSWLNGLLSAAAIYLTIRQGMITCRAGAFPLLYTDNPPYTGETLTDADIVPGTLNVDVWDSTMAAEYQNIAVNSAILGYGTFDDDLQTLPGSELRTYDVSDVAWTNESAVHTEMSTRLRRLDGSVPEIISCDTRGMRWAHLAPGDVITLFSSFLDHRDDYAEAGGQLVVVLQVSPSFERHRVTLRLARYPETEEIFES